MPLLMIAVGLGSLWALSGIMPPDVFVLSITGGLALWVVLTGVRRMLRPTA